MENSFVVSDILMYKQKKLLLYKWVNLLSFTIKQNWITSGIYLIKKIFYSKMTVYIYRQNSIC